MSKKKADATETPDKKDWQQVAEDEATADVVTEETEASTVGDESIAVLEHPSYKKLEDQLTAMEMKAHENWDKALRAMSELENAQKRAKRDVEKAHKFALENFANDLLPIIDSLEQALQTSADADGLREGIELTLKLFSDVLQKFNITSISPEGERFDPNLHEAFATQPSEDAESGTVLVVYQKGYLLNDRVIRPARVIVVKND